MIFTISSGIYFILFFIFLYSSLPVFKTKKNTFTLEPMNRGLSTSGKYQKPFGCIPRVHCQRRIYMPTATLLPSKVFVPSSPLPPSPPHEVLQEVKRKHYHSKVIIKATQWDVLEYYDVALKTQDRTKFCLLAAEKEVRSNEAIPFVDWDFIRELHKLPERQPGPTPISKSKYKCLKNCMTEVQWVQNGLGDFDWYEVPLTKWPKYHGEAVDHQFFYVFQELIKHVERESCNKIMAILNSLLQIAFRVIKPLLEAINNYQVKEVSEPIYLFDTVISCQKVLDDYLIHNLVMDEKMFLQIICTIKQDIITFWRQQDKRRTDTLQRWDTFINGIVHMIGMTLADNNKSCYLEPVNKEEEKEEVVIVKPPPCPKQEEDEEIKLLRIKVRAARKKIDSREECYDEDQSLDNWNEWVELKTQLRELKKQKI